MSGRPPNILWYCTDQQRSDTIHTLGNKTIRTPNLDTMVENGTAFKRAYCQSPICTPSRASFLTGRYPSTTHVHRNGNKHFPRDETPVTKIFADEGYNCGLIGKLHLAGAAAGQEPRTDDGYDTFEYSHHPMAPGDLSSNAYHRWLVEEKGCDPNKVCNHIDGRNAKDVPAELHHTTWATDCAIRFIDQSDDQPWLLSVNVFDPHPPFNPPKEYLDRYPPQDMEAPLFKPSDIARQKAFSDVSAQATEAVDPTGTLENETEFATSPTAPPKSFNGKKIKSAYYGMIELIDAQFGRLIDHLKATGQLENTIVVFHSDHGEMLGDHGLLYKGCRFFEGLVHVPLIIMWRGKFVEGLHSDALVELVDIAPTLLEAAGIERPSSMQGKSLVDILSGRTPANFHKNVVVSEFNDALGSNEDPRPTHATMSFDGRYKTVVYHDMDLGEIFDLKMDPHEFDNLWNDSTHSELRCKLVHQHLDSMMATSSAGIERAGRF